MDTPTSSGQQSSLDSLRTVEFRQTLRGYHIDDVDEYLERVAVEAEALQEQLRQTGERLRQAAERIAALENQLRERPAEPAPQPIPVSDDSLQRTLILAQRFVEQTQAEAEAQARALVADAEDRSRVLVAEAEERVRVMSDEAERGLRDEVTRLESIRAQLLADVEAVARHLDSERARLRSALTDMVRWVDEHVQPASALAGGQPGTNSGAGASTSPAAVPPAATAAGDATRPVDRPPSPEANAPRQQELATAQAQRGGGPNGIFA